MKTQIKLINRTESDFARILMQDGSTLCYADPQEADQMLQVFFGLNQYGREAYYSMPCDKSWEHTEFNSQYHHAI